MADPKARVLALIRSDEQACLKHLPAPASHVTHAYSELLLSRDLYAMVEPPPTRHRQFRVRTIWRKEGWIPERHDVAVRARHDWRVLFVRPGLFGDT